jgi:hypothetical protein
MTGAWQLGERGKMVLLFANVSDEPFVAHLEWEPIRKGLSGASWIATRTGPEGARGEIRIHATDQPEVELAARSVLAWEVVPVQEN